MTRYFLDCRQVRGDVLRLHVIAASDADEDQRLKLLVRDTVLREGAEHLEGDDADWLCSAIEHASDARHSLEKHGPYPRLDKEVLRFDED